MKKLLYIIPVLCVYIFMQGLISCAEDESLLVSDTSYVSMLPVEGTPSSTMAMSDYMANRYVKISQQENRFLFLADSHGLMTLSPVYIPEGEGFRSGTYNFGWPVASMVESTIIISTQRRLLTGQIDDLSGKGQLLIISKDGGKNWDAPIEVQNIQPYGYTVGSQSCIGTFDGNIIQKGNGTMITNNQGENWSPLPRAFKFVSNEEYGANGPRIHDHPAFGLLFFTGTTVDIDTGSVFRSNLGALWEDTYWTTEGTGVINCPGPSSLILDDGSILMMASNGRNMVQYLYEYTAGDDYTDIQFSVDTIENINTSLSAYDVPDLIYNPVTDRIELMESNPAALLLWSIDQSDLMNGSTDWTPDCVPLKRTGKASMHPAGSVVDLASNMQHLILYIGGEYSDRNCLYMLSRTLDSDQLSEWVNKYRVSEGL